MTWNFRVVEHEYPYDEDGFFAIHEVFYDSKGEVRSWTEFPVGVYTKRIKDMPEMFSTMQQALALPVLKKSELDKLMEAV